MSKRRGLGRGLAELIPAGEALREGETVVELSLDLIDPNPFQPRRDFPAQELAELAASIATQGLLQPVTVRPAAHGRFQLVAGERRLRATRDLGRTAIRALIREVDDRQLLELSLVENVMRADLNDIEVAEAFRRLEDLYGYSATQLASATGKSRPAVSNTLRLLELPAGVQELIRQGKLTAGHGRAVLSYPEAQRESVAAECAREGFSVREIERRAAAASARPPVARSRKKPQGLPSAPSALRRYENQLQDYLGTKVKLGEVGGKGNLTIQYHGADDLKRILDLLLSGTNPL